MFDFFSEIRGIGEIREVGKVGKTKEAYRIKRVRKGGG